MREKMLSYFEIEKLNTTVKHEVLTGSTTFISMAYILFADPAVLGVSGMDKGAMFTATALASAISCVPMGVLARYPIEAAPTFGINAFFAYSVRLGMGTLQETVLAGVFIAPLIPILITIFKLRGVIIDAVSADLKCAISGGIGLFVAFPGLSKGGIIVSNESTLVGLESPNVGSTWSTIFGSVATAILLIRHVPGGISVEMTATTISGLVTGLVSMSSEIVAAAPSLKPISLVALKHVGGINSPQMWVVILTFLLMAFFDTARTLVGLANQAGLMKDSEMPCVGKALASDSTAMLVGSLFGISLVGALVESSIDIAAGERSGVTATIAGIFFLLSLFFSPLLSAVTPQVTVPTSIIVRISMTQPLRQIEWESLEIVIPSFLTLIGVPLTYSISDGIALGFILYPITMLATEGGKEVSPIIYGLFFVPVRFMRMLNVK